MFSMSSPMIIRVSDELALRIDLARPGLIMMIVGLGIVTVTLGLTGATDTRSLARTWRELQAGGKFLRIARIIIGSMVTMTTTGLVLGLLWLNSFLPEITRDLDATKLAGVTSGCDTTFSPDEDVCRAWVVTAEGAQEVVYETDMEHGTATVTAVRDPDVVVGETLVDPTDAAPLLGGEDAEGTRSSDVDTVEVTTVNGETSLWRYAHDSTLSNGAWYFFKI